MAYHSAQSMPSFRSPEKESAEDVYFGMFNGALLSRWQSDQELLYNLRSGHVLTPGLKKDNWSMSPPYKLTSTLAAGRGTVFLDWSIYEVSPTTRYVYTVRTRDPSS